MPILRAGPWGNLTDSFQDVPLDTSAELSYYPVNCAKTNWASGQVWAAYYEVTAGCATPATVTVTDSFWGSITLNRVEGECQVYYWVHPYGAYYGEADLYWNGSDWTYDESLSYAPFQSATGGGGADDPTGTYTGDMTRTMT